MGRSPCCDKVGLKKGPWTPEEDQKLLAYIEDHGHGSWRALPTKAGLQRCGKSCRLRWTNYLRPDIKRGKFTLQEEQTIIQLHALLGNRWSAIATHLPKRTDNEIKNHWNTHLKKRLAKMGIDPVTHKPKNDAFSSADGQTMSNSNISHMAQWESARLEAEARLVRESRLRSNHPLGMSDQILGMGLDLGQQFNKAGTTTSTSRQPHCLDVQKSWQGMWSRPTKCGGSGICGDDHDLESPTSTLCFSENSMPMPIVTYNDNTLSSLELMTNSESYVGRVEVKEECQEAFQKLNYKNRMEDEMGFSLENPWASESSKMVNNNHIPATNFIEGFTNLLLGNPDERITESNNGDIDNADGTGCDAYEENKNYWNNILNLVDSSSPDSQDF